MNEKGLLKKAGFIILPVLLLVGYYYLSNMVYYGAYQMLVDVFKVSEEFFMKYSYIMEVATYIVMLIPLIIVYAFLFKRKKEETLNYSNKIAVISIGTGIGVSGVSCLWMILLDKVLINIPIFKKSLEILEQANESLGNEGTIGVVLIAVILAPIIEELLFRGIIFNSLEKVKSGWLPVVISAIMFGAYHMNLVQAVYATFMGIIAAIIYPKNRNLLYPVLVHMANNLIGAIQSVVGSQELVNAVDVFTIIMIVFMIGGVYWISKKLKMPCVLSHQES